MSPLFAGVNQGNWREVMAVLSANEDRFGELLRENDKHVRAAVQANSCRGGNDGLGRFPKAQKDACCLLAVGIFSSSVTACWASQGQEKCHRCEFSMCGHSKYMDFAKLLQVLIVVGGLKETLFSPVLERSLRRFASGSGVSGRRMLFLKDRAADA
uniref:Uncharacterized protein n=1 Tax=Chromera velia CCMP2878 TaxID=1169474 RepID=A0A0G4HT28_9ALVE|eukprot:Cvel_8368.t1-p1 / transcript=Cvel_8368.t1 / gene=Cvel_8368 / organism=Chromera_velia_CCMP2878 / gene_product=hypothetical protein / transcript_product=hypothetical protein / location=Cvel_scaffold461:23063-23898(-) / protein_length=155 / sequence_SO=supercontig / SO=protein_coding / is_pseudo=false